MCCKLQEENKNGLSFHRHCFSRCITTSFLCVILTHNSYKLIPAAQVTQCSISDVILAGVMCSQNNITIKLNQQALMALKKSDPEGCCLYLPSSLGSKGITPINAVNADSSWGSGVWEPHVDGMLIYDYETRGARRDYGE